MSPRILVTKFAAAERVPIEVVQRQRAALAESPALGHLLEGIEGFVFVLNAQRQIVQVSRNVQDLLSDQGLEGIIGRRPGEALDCLHAHDHEGGCGTSEACQECGVVKTILTGLQGREATAECGLIRVLRLTPVAFDLLVHARPLEFQGGQYTVFSIRSATQRAGCAASRGRRRKG